MRKYKKINKNVMRKSQESHDKVIIGHEKVRRKS